MNKRGYIQSPSPGSSYVLPAVCSPLVDCLQSTYTDLQMSSQGKTMCQCAHNESTVTKVACVIATLSAILYITAYSSDSWVIGNSRRERENNQTDLHLGLWKTCYTPLDQNRVCLATKDFLRQDWNDEWLPGVQTMFTLGLVMHIVTSIDLWLYLTVPRLQLMAGALFLAGCATFATGALTFLGILVFGIQQNSGNANFQNTDLDWSYAIMVVSLVCTLLAYFLIMVDFYSVLYEKANEKSRMKQARRQLLNALDEAVIENQAYTIQTHSQPSQGSTGSLDSQTALCQAEQKPTASGRHDDTRQQRDQQSYSTHSDKSPQGSEYNDQALNRGQDVDNSDHGQRYESVEKPSQVNVPVGLFQAKKY